MGKKSHRQTPKKTRITEELRTTESSLDVDAKLLHLVRKYVRREGSSSLESIVNILQTEHREYQQKDLQWMILNVEKCILTIEEKKGNNSVQQKRSLEQMEEEALYDAEAKEHDTLRNNSGGGGGGFMSLNAGLQSSYKQQQVQKQQLEEKEGNTETTTNNKTVVKKRVLKRRKSSADQMGSAKLDKPAFLDPVSPRPTERYTDLGGIDDIIVQIRQLIEYPLLRPELYEHLGVDPPRGVLLRGPPGCGKTHLANAIAGQLDLPFFRVSAPELVSGMSGESEGRIRDLFQAASDRAPSLIFMDELDAIAPKRSDGRGMEKRMVAQLLISMDMIAPQFNKNKAAVLVLGATNRPDAMDPALRRAGRFDKELLLGVPDEASRKSILITMTKKIRISKEGFCYDTLAHLTPGYVGADVRSLTKEAAVIAINRIFRSPVFTKDRLPSTQFLPQDDEDHLSKDSSSETKKENNDEAAAAATVGTITPFTPHEMKDLYVTMEDFRKAIPLVQPSSQREGFATVPDVSWDKIGALQQIRDELTLSVLEPIRHPEKFRSLGLSLPAGVLLYGPPGCGKTLLAKAIANESGANFLSVKGPELLDKYVGESERSVRLVFERARSSSPCVVFFDELDSLCPKRGSDGGGGGGVSERVVNQLLTEMDGLGSRGSVFVMAATNRPELIDPAMMRPGRLDKLLYVPLPTAKDRVSILLALSSGLKLAADVDLEQIGLSSCADGYSGADCAALLREAGLAVLKESMAAEQENSNKKMPPMCIGPQHFKYAFDHVLPSVTARDQARYDRLRDRMAQARSRTTINNNNANSTRTNDDDATRAILPSSS